MGTRENFFDGVAKTINTGGEALVAVYDTGASLLQRTCTKLLACEKSTLSGSIKEYQAKIHNLLIELGRESSRFTEPAEAFAAAQVQALISQLKEYEEAISAARQRIEELARERNAKREALWSFNLPVIKRENLFANVLGSASARLAGEKALSAGAFKDLSNREIFKRVARYLLSNETELRRILVKDLGTTGDCAALPALVESLNDTDAGVRIAALESIRSITGADLEFDVNAEGEALAAQINLLKASLDSWSAAREPSPREPVTELEEAVVLEEVASADAAEPEAEELQPAAGQLEPEIQQEAAGPVEAAETPQEAEAETAVSAEAPQVRDEGEELHMPAAHGQNVANWKRTRTKK